MNDQTTTIRELKDAVADFVEARDWRQFHDPKNLAMSIAIESAELMEHFQWLRSDQVSPDAWSDETRQDITDELADILCFALSFANAADIDIASAVRAKMVKNEKKYPKEKFHGRFR